MKSRMKIVRALRSATSAAVLVPLLAMPLPAAAQSADDKWHLNVMPYLWLPTISGTLKFPSVGSSGGPTVDFKANPNDYIGDIEMALLLALEARKGKWLVYSDVTYMKLGADDSNVKAVNFGGNAISTTLDSGTQTTIQATIWTVAGGYNLVQDPKVSLDLIAGARYLYLKATTDWQLTATVTDPVGGGVFPRSGSVSDSGDIWDGIVGVKGRVKLGDGNWFMPYYLDAGTGGSKYTYQAQTGIGYTFRWGDLLLGYRYLAYKQDDDSKVIQDLKMYGFGFGGLFRF
jgi:hypothetical protein